MDQNPTGNTQNDQGSQSVEDKRQLCYEVIKGTYDFNLAVMDSWDTKANNLSIIAGIIVGLYSGFGKSILDSIDKTKFVCDSVTYYNLFLATLIIGIIILLVSICCALFAYRAYNVHAVPNAHFFYDHYVTNDECTKGNILDSLTLALVSADDSNRKDAQNKAFYVTVSLILLFAGSTVCVIFVILALVVTRM